MNAMGAIAEAALEETKTKSLTHIQNLISDQAKKAQAKQLLGAAKSLGISQRKFFAALKADGASPEEVANWYLLWLDA